MNLRNVSIDSPPGIEAFTLKSIPGSLSEINFLKCLASSIGNLFNILDICPDTPTGETVDSTGCIEILLSVDDEIRVKRMFDEHSSSQHKASNFPIVFSGGDTPDNSIKVNDLQDIEPSLSLIDSEKELIKMALEKYNNRRKDAAEELGISERTLYRKIKEYSLK